MEATGFPLTKENEAVVKKSEVSSFYMGWSGDISIEHPLDNLEHPMSLFRKFRQEKWEKWEFHMQNHITRK